MGRTDAPSTLFELLPIGAYRSSIDGQQLRANAALVRLNGYTSEAEMLAAVRDIGREWYVEPARREQFIEQIRRDGQVLNFVSEVYRHKTRERIWIRETAHLVRDTAGHALFCEGTVEDITAQRRAEQALHASERRFRALTEKSQVLTLVCSAAGEAFYVSPASRWLLGHEPEALQRAIVFDHVHPDDVARARHDLAAVLVHRQSGVESICRVRHADGSWRHLAMLANNCLADPAVAGVVLSLRDVSERVRAEEALRSLNIELEQRVQQRTAELVHARDAAESANRAKSEFLSRMSHELCTPLNAIFGFGRLLGADSAMAPAQRGHLDQLLSAAERLLGMIEELLELSRIESGELRLALEPVDLLMLIEHGLQQVDPAGQRARLAPHSAHGVAWADRARLSQVLLNLLRNAVEHGAAPVQVECIDEGAMLRIDVSDSGSGLSEEQQLHLFDERAGPAGERAGSLATSKRLVELMQGQIGLRSGPGGGSTFWVRLSRSAPPRAAPAPSQWVDTASPGLGSDGRTVLYIEDNPVNVLLMEAMLAQQSQLRLLSAELPEAGLALAQSENPALILLDIQLPGIDGYEVLRRLQAAPDTRDIPVIAISANAMPGDIERGRAAGFVDYLTKPLDQPRLLAAIGAALGAANASSSSSARAG
jgi:PAS domain S-box-containing protein